MSGQLIGGVVGAAIGFVVSGYNPMGAQVGWAAGSIVGGALDPTRIDGPHLADRKVQVSTYGAAIPILYGGNAGSGNVIWSTDLVEHDVESEGKGTVTTSHTYSVSCAVLIGEVPADVTPTLRRIWADAKIVYDVSDGSDAVAQAASAAFAAYFVFYPGDEAQLPDPTIEAALGAGNVPAYRGCVYIVFTDLPLEDYGNRIPNFKFEVSTEAATATDTEDLQPELIAPWQLDYVGTEYITNGPFTLEAHETYRPGHGSRTTEYKVQLSTTPGDFYTTTDWAAAIAAFEAAWPGHVHYMGYYTSQNQLLSWHDPDTGINDGLGARYAYLCYGAVMPTMPAIDSGGPTTGCYVFADRSLNPTDATENEIHLFDNLGHGIAEENQAGHCGPAQLLHYGETPLPENAPYDEGISACINYPDESGELLEGWYPTVSFYPLRFIRAERILSPPTQTCEAGDPCVLGIAQVPGNTDFCITCDGDVSSNLQYTPEAGTYRQLTTVFVTSIEYDRLAVGPILRSTDPNYNNSTWWDAEAAAAGISGTYGVEYGHASTDAAVADIPANQVDAGSADLADIVTDICTRAGMPDGAPLTFDVSALVGIEVQGYAIARQMPARQALLPLQQTFWWDFVESGREIKAVLRGAASAVTIELDDLGASEASGEPPVAVLPTRGQEAELPATVSVSYFDREAAYEAGTQRARRVVTGSQQQMAVEMPVVMSHQRAANVADVLLYAAWTNRTERTWATTRKFAKYEPTDVVTLDDGEFTYLLRVIERNESGGVISWRGVDELPAAYDPNATPGNSSGNGIAPIAFDGPTKLVLLDVPIVAPDHDDPGHYAAASGYRSSWPGGTALKSIDGGSTYTTAQSMPLRATIGYANTALGDWTSGNMVDESNTVEVRMHAGTLSSISASQLLNGGNTALLGDEIIRFRTATLVETGVYRLSGLLRGRRGTEQHMGAHLADEIFVLFNANVYRIDGAIADLDVAGLWKGVTYGQSADAVTAQAFTNTGVGLKPLAPVHLYGTDIGGGEYRLTWVRRTRLDGKWRDVEVPLGEASESYTVEVVSSYVVQSTQTTTATTLDVTAAAGDWVNVYQNSATVGRGFPATVTLT